MSSKAYKQYQKIHTMRQPKRKIPKLTGREFLKARGFFGKEGYNELSPEVRHQLENERNNNDQNQGKI